MSASSPTPNERPATLSAASEVETPFGGRTRAWAPVAAVWATLQLDGIAERTASDAPPVGSQAATAVARDHPAAAPGQQLAFAGEPPFEVREVRRATPVPGRMTLVLVRQL